MKDLTSSRVEKLPEGRLAVLSLVSGSEVSAAAQVFRVHKDRITIGSVDSADVRLSAEGVSPIHAVIEIPEDGSVAPAVIYDLASATGVFVNGEKIVTQKIRSGDLLTIGRFKLKFSMDEPVGKTERTRVSVDGRKLDVGSPEDFRPLMLEDDRLIREIFEPATERRALEVVMSWCGTILDILHFSRYNQVIVGSERSCDFPIPPLKSGAKFPIAAKSGEYAVLRFDASMSGVVQSKGDLKTLSELRSTAVASAWGSEIPFGEKDFAKITVGEVDFYFSHTAAPPRLKRQNMTDPDPFYHRILGSSLLFTVLFIVSMLRATVPPTMEVEDVPERIATILYQPERFERKPEPKTPEVKVEPVVKPVVPPTPKPITKIEIQPKLTTPKPVPKTMDTGKKQEVATKGKTVEKAKGAGSLSQNEAKEGEGARAKGAEGTRGTKNAPKVEKVAPQNIAKRPSAQGGTGRGGGRSQVPQSGNVDFLKGTSSKILNLLGSSSAQLGGSGSKLEGFGGFSTNGGGGLALSGDGKGGGGTADSLGGLGKKGPGGGRVGTGLGAAGSGSGIVGGSTRVRIQSGGPEEAVVMGAIDADAVEAALNAHRDEFRYCYEKEINAETPKIAGRVGTSFVIGSSGRVTRAGIESSSLGNANVERCVVNVIKRIDFPIPRGGGVVQVAYPFKFQSGG